MSHLGDAYKRKQAQNIDWEWKFIEIINDILKELGNEGEIPSIRGMYYILVSRYPKEIANTRSTYSSFDRATVKARKREYKSNPKAVIEEDAFVDNIRRILDIADTFITGRELVDNLNAALNNAANSYSIPRWNGQPNYVEVWLEKDAVVSMFRSILRSGRNGPDREVRIVPNRGWTSRTFLMKNIQRLIEQTKAGKTVHVLYFADYDPTGLKAAEYLENQLAKYGISDFELVSIKKEQFNEFNLQDLTNPNPETLAKLEGTSKKKGDPNTAWFKRNHGEGRVFQVELDAMFARREQFTKLVLDAVDSKFDRTIFEKEVELRLHKERENIGTELHDIFNGSGRRISTSIMISDVLNALNFHTRRMTEDIISWISDDSQNW
jgi:hypothetical protein